MTSVFCPHRELPQRSLARNPRQTGGKHSTACVLLAVCNQEGLVPSPQCARTEQDDPAAARFLAGCVVAEPFLLLVPSQASAHRCARRTPGLNRLILQSDCEVSHLPAPPASRPQHGGGDLKWLRRQTQLGARPDGTPALCVGEATMAAACGLRRPKDCKDQNVFFSFFFFFWAPHVSAWLLSFLIQGSYRGPKDSPPGFQGTPSQVYRSFSWRTNALWSVCHMQQKHST